MGSAPCRAQGKETSNVASGERIMRRIIKVSEMEFPANDSTVPFTLADGHSYFIHRLTREGKPTSYALMAAEGSSGSFTPYITEGQMDSVLYVREMKAVKPTLDGGNQTGYVCPGCGAVATPDGVHVGPANPREAELIPGEPKMVVNDKNQVELLPEHKRDSRFFDRS